uniref:Uncharacterized protein n=1 Tax=uncultured Armatimonadetes bacterium TaxID=157466 RepID=A0A6J4HVG7_9BACT|nr:hypothetical protein AVDCRST_MAG63-1141 [uncultured Armatimonadetes bacterium]
MRKGGARAPPFSFLVINVFVLDGSADNGIGRAGRRLPRLEPAPPLQTIRARSWGNACTKTVMRPGEPSAAGSV